ALVGRQAGVGAGGVRQGGPQQVRLPELVADGGLALVEDVRLAAGGQFPCHDDFARFRQALTRGYQPAPRLVNGAAGAAREAGGAGLGTARLTPAARRKETGRPQGRPVPLLVPSAPL